MHKILLMEGGHLLGACGKAVPIIDFQESLVDDC